MNSVAELSRSWPRAVALTLIAAGLAGCSADATRFNDGTSRGQQGEVTGSIAPGQAAPVARVDARPLPQTSQAPAPPYAARTASNESPVTAGGSTGGGRGIASYNPGAPSYNYGAPAYNPQPVAVAYSPQPSPEFTGSVVAPNSVVRKPVPQGQWTWDGGTAITVTPGETIDGIARRYAMPASAILEANNLNSHSSIQAGQRLVIPRLKTAETVATVPAYRTASLGTPKSAPSFAPASAPLTVPAAAPALASASNHAAGPINAGVHVVAPGETLIKIAHQYGKSLAELAKANHIPPYSKISIGDRIVIPGVRTSKLDPEPPPQATASLRPAAAPSKDVAGGPVQSASLVTPAAEAPAPETSVKAAVDAIPSFRWPVRGRIIAAFGPKPNGQQNDGINVAVPENTPIKAAEDGVVAYAGNELKGYGNLVLVRHTGGYVTAYANAKELLVKRGDQVKRGQIIAKSGQSGDVDGPQLHFEVRKGSSPVDPMQFLGGA